MAKISIATILIRNHPMSNRLVAFLVLLVTIIIGGWALYYVFVTRGVKLELHITPANIDTRIDISYLQTPLTTTVCKTLCTISYPQKSGLSMEITASGYTSQSFDLSSSPTSLDVVLTKSLVTLESIKQSISSWSAVQERIKTLESRTQSNTGITFSWNILTITPQGSWSILLIENESIPLTIAYNNILSAHRLAQDPNIIHIPTKQWLVRVSRWADDTWQISSPHPIYRDTLPYRDGMIGLRQDGTKFIIEYQTPKSILTLGSYEDEILSLDLIGDSLALLQKDGRWSTISLDTTRSIIQ